MDTSSEEVGPTEGAVLALLDFLVDPLLPSKYVLKKPAQENLVAKQVHAVVLIYNYYHRKQNPALEFLDPVSFSKLAMRLKPSLVPYLKPLRWRESELNDPEHTSLTEKEIMKACHISKSLDALKIKPVIEGWPITKVVVFLVDNKKEKCFLFHSSVTQGVWSTIEKDLPGEEAASEARNMKNRVIKKTPKENKTPDEAVLQKVACLAIKEACGLSRGDLRILETHTVYSLSKANAAVRLYIMQCTQSKQDVELVPINDAIDSLQGPLVTKESGSWIVTSVVDYFHLLPFADIVANWRSSDSKMHENAAQDFGTVKENGCFRDFCFDVEEVPPPSDNFEAVKKLGDHSSSHLNQNLLLKTSEPLGTSKDHRNGNIYQSKVEDLKLTLKLPNGLEVPSDHFEAVKKLGNHSSSHLNHNLLLNTSEPLGTSKDNRNGNIYRPKVEDLKLSLKPPNGLEVPNGSSCLAKEGTLSFASALSGTVKEVRSGCIGQLNKERLQLAFDRSKTSKESENIYNYRRKNEATEPIVYKKRNKFHNINSDKVLGGQTSNATPDSTRHKEDRAASGSSSSMDVYEPIRTCQPVGEAPRVLSCGDHGDDQKQMAVAQEPHRSAINGGAIVLPEVRDTNSLDHYVEKQKHDIVSFNSNLEQLQKIQQSIISKQALLSQTALNVLCRKRELLSQQLRSIGDEIALCDRKMEIVLKGGEDDLSVELDAVLEGCNDLCRISGAAEDRASLTFHDPGLPPIMKRPKLSETNLCLPNACQELDNICNKNSWILPTYNISITEGGFRANVTMKGPDFECSSEGTICANPQEARIAAASNLLRRLQSVGMGKFCS